MRSVAIALVHYPVMARDGQTVTTSITNLDIHDIARSARTYDVSPYFIVHPIAAQRELAGRIVSHWTDGSGAQRIPDRAPAMGQVVIVESLDEALARLGPETEIWVTSAKPLPSAIGPRTASRILRDDGPPVLLVFGTGWGLSSEVTERSHRSLEPIISPRADGYNHLSVRAAAAIYLDRLLAPESAWEPAGQPVNQRGSPEKRHFTPSSK